MVIEMKVNHLSIKNLYVIVGCGTVGGFAEQKAFGLYCGYLRNAGWDDKRQYRI